MAKKRRSKPLKDEAVDQIEAIDTSDLERASQTMPKVIFGIFLGISLLLLLIAGITGYLTGSRMAKEKSAPGVILDQVVRRDSDGNEYYYPLVEFSLPGGGEKRVQLSEGSWPPAYENGQPVTVLYDPDNPLSARIQSFWGTLVMWIGTLITGFVGIVFLAAAIIVKKVF